MASLTVMPWQWHHHDPYSSPRRLIRAHLLLAGCCSISIKLLYRVVCSKLTVVMSERGRGWDGQLSPHPFQQSSQPERCKQFRPVGKLGKHNEQSQLSQTGRKAKEEATAAACILPLPSSLPSPHLSSTLPTPLPPTPCRRPCRRHSCGRSKYTSGVVGLSSHFSSSSCRCREIPYS